jgi:hypothetical protein
MISHLELIDWRMVGFACLWIIGLAVVCATFGFVQYEAQRTTRRFWYVYKESGYQGWVYAGLSLFCLGLIGSSQHWWEFVAWIVLAIWFLLNLILKLRSITRN